MADAFTAMCDEYPEEKQRIDTAASEALNEASGAHAVENFGAALNTLRGMCPDGCCGGIQDDEHPTPFEIARHYYIAILLVRGTQHLSST
jgi:hypothetical protein